MGSWLLLDLRGRGREVEGTFVVFAGSWSWRRRREVAKVRKELGLRVLLSLKMLLYKRREDMFGKGMEVSGHVGWTWDNSLL